MSRSSSTTCRSARRFSIPPQVDAAQTRVVATFSIAGHPRKLWVAPTRQGGYCYTFERSFGGCRQTPARPFDRRQRASSASPGKAARGNLRLNESIVTRVGGDITAPAAAKITATYADGTTHDIPFVWVSSPIAAGFYSYDIPIAHWNKQHRLLALTLYAATGSCSAGRRSPTRRHARATGEPLAAAHITGPKQRVLPTSAGRPAVSADPDEAQRTGSRSSSATTARCSSHRSARRRS